MYPYPSARFAAALQTDHLVAVKMEIWRPGATQPAFIVEQVNDEFSTTTGLVITDGSVTQDKNSDQRFQCSVTCVSPDGSMIPQGNFDLLTPWGNEIRLYRGIFYPPIVVGTNTETVTIPGQTTYTGTFGSGTFGSGFFGGTQFTTPATVTEIPGSSVIVDDYVEYVPLGVFRISKVDIDDNQGAPVMTITGYDRSRNVSRNVVQYYWPDFATQGLILNKSWANMIQIAIASQWPSATFDGTADQWAAQQNDPVNGIIPNFLQSFSEGTDLFSQMRQYAQAAGCELTLTRAGIFTMFKDPNFTSMVAGPWTPVASFIEGATAMFEETKRTLDDSAAYNQVIVFGSGDILGVPLFTYPPNGTPAVDNDPSSPTYIGVGTVDSSGTISYAGGSPYGVVTHIVNNNLLTTIGMCQNFAQLQLVLDLGAQQAASIPSMAVNPCLDVDDLIAIQRLRIGLNEAVGFIITNVQTPLMAKSKQQITVKEKRNLQSVAA